MTNYNRDLLLLYRAEVFNEELLQQEVECLHRILRRVECHDVFCNAHELVTRTKITAKARAILNAVSQVYLKPFYFLINKN